MGAIYRELGTGWTLFAALWTTGLACGVGTLFYQVARWSQHPEQSATWVAVIGLAGPIGVLAKRRYGRAGRARVVRTTSAE